MYLDYYETDIGFINPIFALSNGSNFPRYSTESFNQKLQATNSRPGVCSSIVNPFTFKFTCLDFSLAHPFKDFMFSFTQKWCFKFTFSFIE
jgi:hypothetical protein